MGSENNESLEIGLRLRIGKAWRPLIWVAVLAVLAKHLPPELIERLTPIVEIAQAMRRG